jgi:hypothetical protein
MFRIVVLLLSNHWFSQYYAKWFKRKPNGLKITTNGLGLAKPTSEALIITLLSMYYTWNEHQSRGSLRWARAGLRNGIERFNVVIWLHI